MYERRTLWNCLCCWQVRRITADDLEEQPGAKVETVLKSVIEMGDVSKDGDDDIVLQQLDQNEEAPETDRPMLTHLQIGK